MRNLLSQADQNRAGVVLKKSNMGAIGKDLGVNSTDWASPESPGQRGHGECQWD